MQNYIGFAEKNGITLLDTGACQFCGAATTRGIHECNELFSLGFDLLNFGQSENHAYRFMSVDAHALQHPEIHGRWSNHFHLTRQHLMFTHQVQWSYALSPQLSDVLNRYKATRMQERLAPPPSLKRGEITTTTIAQQATTEQECQEWVERWGRAVYAAWEAHHDTIEQIAQQFLSGRTRYRRT